MPQRRALLALLLMGLFAGSARAEDAYVPPMFSVQLLGGASGRSTQLQPSAELGHVRGSSITGAAPLYFRVDSSVFFLRWLGLEADGLGDVFVARSGNTRVSSQRFAARGGLALRWASAGGFTLSGSLGYGVWQAPVIIHPTFNELDAKQGFVRSHGPVARLGVGLEKGRFDGSLSAILQVPVSGAVRVLTLEPRVWLGARVWDPSPTTSLYLGADVGALVERGGIYDGFTVRFGVSARFTLHEARKTTTPTTGGDVGKDGLLVVRVTLPDGAMAKGASVSLDGLAPMTLDETGELRVTPGHGVHTVQVALAGFRTATERVELDGDERVVNVALIAPSGPGRLSGVVRAAAGNKPLADALVNVAEQSTRTAADGTYAFDRAGPGPVQVRVEAQGFNPGVEVAQVPAEGAATLDFALEPLGKGSPATVRGLVRSRSGAALKANVTVRGLKQRVAVTPEGRFVISVPAGEYTFVISAPGHISQQKKVTLADGEQAIFHCELLTVTR